MSTNLSSIFIRIVVLRTFRRVLDFIKAIIEYKRNPERAGKAKDLYAWIVHFYNEWGDGEAHVDAINREVVNVIPSG